jgi:hypothetical protein
MINNHDSYLTLSVNYNGTYTRGVPAGVVGYDPNELVIADAESVTVASLRAGMSFGSWSTGFFVENLFDSDDTVGQFLTAAGRTDVTSRAVRPRIIGLALEYEF